MYTAFLVLALLGGSILVIQLLLSLFGFEVDAVEFDGTSGPDAALHLFSVRALTAAATFFGIGGLAVMAGGAGWPLAIAVGSVLGVGAAIGVSVLMRSFGALESDGTVRIDTAIGLPGKVYLEVPGSEAGIGKVHVVLGSRTQEYRAITRGSTLGTGAPVMVVDVIDANTVEVASPIHLLGAE
jgi:hypothetical protein